MALSRWLSRFFSVWLVCLPLPLHAADRVVAGAGSAHFELPAGTPLAGYSRRKGHAAQGVHDPVGARALVLEDADTTTALVSCDLLIIDERLFNAVRSRLPGAGLPQHTALILAATHTHSGPGAYGRKFFEKLSMGHYDPAVSKRLEDAIVEAIRAAYAARAEALIAVASSRAPGLVRNRIDPQGPVDDELIVQAFFRPEARTPFALLVNFSAHPTTLGAWNMRFSADYPGVLRRELEQRFPGSACLFFAGAVGDQGPVKSGAEYESAEHVGRQLASGVAEALKDAVPVDMTAVETRQEIIPLPPARVRLGRRVRLPRWLGQRFVDDDAALSVLRLGSTAIFGVPCDMESELGARLQSAARAQRLQPLVIGFANDYIGYCVSEARYHSAEYEAMMAFNGPRTGELIIERLIQMLELATSDKRPATSEN